MAKAVHEVPLVAFLPDESPCGPVYSLSPSSWTNLAYSAILGGEDDLIYLARFRGNLTDEADPCQVGAVAAVFGAPVNEKDIADA